MMLVHHTGNAIESEPIDLILLHVEPQIGKQETQDLVRPIIEQPAVPEFVTPTVSFVEIEMVAAIKAIQTIKDILASVRMHHV